VLLYEASDFDGAERAWWRCLEHSEARAVAATNLGFLFEKRGDMPGARKAYLAAARWGDPTGQAMADRLSTAAKP
jgi:Flp pilus assembly protein TadD